MTTSRYQLSLIKALLRLLLNEQTLIDGFIQDQDGDPRERSSTGSLKINTNLGQGGQKVNSA